MEEQDLIRDVSTEELLELKKKAAKHKKNMKAVKNVKDVVAEAKKPKAAAKLKPAKTKKTASDDKWLDDFSHMSSKTTLSSAESAKQAQAKRTHSAEGFSQKPLEQAGSENIITEEISIADVSRGHHQDEVISEDILEELGIKPSVEKPEVEAQKPVIIPGVKVFKKPISSPIVESPPEKPLGPRDSLSDADDKPDVEQVATPKLKAEHKRRFPLRFGRKKQPEAEPQQPAKPEPKTKEVLHMLYQDPAKEAEQRAQNNLNYFEDASIDLHSDDQPDFKVHDKSPQTVIEREDFKQNLNNQAESGTSSDMIFTPEARVIRNIQKKPSGYSMVATISEGGYAFKLNKAKKEVPQLSHEHKFRDIEKANRSKIMGKSSPRLGLLDIISIVIILAALMWFFYLIILA